ncbi:MAG: GNAT family N-acetyltransferase [bacterium]|nr:GNAT family N-acetyltransferase [bacterium]
MKINNQIKYNTNFGGIPLYRAILQQKKLLTQPEPVEAFVSAFEKSDICRAALDYRKWWLTRFGDEIINTMEEKVVHYKRVPNDFLLVEVPSAPKEKQVAAIASYNLQKDKLILSAIQSKSEVAIFNKIKGAGSFLMYALSKKAEEKRVGGIFLQAAREAIRFYEKLGFRQIEQNEYCLPRASFRKFQKQMEAKYKIISA